MVLIVLAACAVGGGDPAPAAGDASAVPEPPCAPGDWFADEDGDGYGDVATRVAACVAPSGHVVRAGDCDDASPDVSPAGAETCDGAADEDCDGTADEPDAAGCTPYYVDEDGDGAGRGATACLCGPEEPFVATSAGDCDDTDPRYDTFCGPTAGARDAAYGVLLGEENGDMAGYAVAGGGDVDGDGTADVVVGAPSSDRGTLNGGAAYVVSAEVAGTVDLGDATAIITGDRGAAMAVAIVPPPEPDGVAGVLVGAEDEETFGREAGAAWWFEGPVTGALTVWDADAVLSLDQPMDGIGYVVAGAGDTDGDGAADVVVGARNSSSGGTAQAYLVRGPLGGDVHLSGADARIYEEVVGDGAPSSIVAGDLDGDGLADLVLGVGGNDGGGAQSTGSAYVLYGPVPGEVTLGEADARLRGSRQADSAGWCVALLGDVEGDGLPDVGVGAPGRTDASGHHGLAYIVASPPRGEASLEASRSLLRGSGGMVAGCALAGLGDRDGDGRADVAVGAGLDSTGAAEGGAVYLLRSPAAGVTEVLDARERIVGLGAGDMFGLEMAGWGDRLIVGVYGDETFWGGAAYLVRVE